MSNSTPLTRPKLSCRLVDAAKSLRIVFLTVNYRHITIHEGGNVIQKVPFFNFLFDVLKKG
jgi:hypothetical protein